MKLLILTQKVDINDDVLGFMHGWIKEFARRCDKVTVICLAKGPFNLPANVKVLSLGKESGASRTKYLINFFKYIWQERKNYDAVFTHMNYEYVILGGIAWRLLGKKIGLWYAHGYTPPSLRIAEKLSNIIFTSTRSGFRLPSRKIRVVGQGIDIDKFARKDQGAKSEQDIFKIITVGRISPVKDYKTLILAAEILVGENFKFKVKIIGGPATTADKTYLEQLRKMAEDKKLADIIEFTGPIANKDVYRYLQAADLFVNMSHTGSLDKAILEAMVCELPVLTCNEALLGILGGDQNRLIYPKSDYAALAERIKIIYKLNNNDKLEIGRSLREIVARNYNLTSLVEKITNIYGKL